MNDRSVSGNLSVSVCMGRQPVFDVKRHLWGYELFCVSDHKNSAMAGLVEKENVAVNVASSTYINIQQMMDQGKKIMVDFTEKGLLGELPYALPPVFAAIRITEDLWRMKTLAESMNQLKADGYLIVVDDFTADPECEAFYKMADILCMDIASLDNETLHRLTGEALEYEGQLLARSITRHEEVKTYGEMGFTLFHGTFFKTPEMLTVRKISSSEISRFTLLKIMEEKDPNITKLAKTIQADVSISFRLLSYLNSAAFGFSQPIQSIQHAINLVGWSQIKKWLRVVILSDMGRSSDTPELLVLSAQRGKFLEKVAEDHNFWGFSPDSLFMLGTFSLLDTILGIPMEKIVEHLPVENKLKKALCQDPNNEYLPLLKLAQSLEETRWEEAESLIQNLNLDHEKVKAALQAAINWANEIASVRI
ncbi:MAG: HDOD domain-containing protein [Proteobacteria bacterium]|nr:HDOD domain-containing protein [Pseudomonadota bacterium]MBU4055489.1 HDOD domain-containing protein [Pseudomonadota bacterium]